MLRLAVVTSAALLVLLGCSEAAEPPADNGIVVTGQANTVLPGPAPAESRGQDFVAAVMGGLDFALASARQVAERGEPANAKALAQKMVADLTAPREELIALAQAGNIKAEPVSGPTDQTDLAVLSSTRGVPLSQAFATQQMNALTLLVGTVRAYKNGGDNPQLKAWAEKHQGVINERLLDVQTLNAELEGTS